MSEKRKNQRTVVGIFTTTCAVFLFGVSLITLTPPARAATGNMYFSPSSTTVNNSANTTLNLRINPGTPVQGVTATVNFDSTKLQYVGISYAGTPFDFKVVETVGVSSIRLERAIVNQAGHGSDALIAAITFKALPYSGTSTVTLSNANAAFNGVYTDPTLGSAVITFRPGSCPSGQTGTPPNCAPASSTPKPSTPSPSTPSTSGTPSQPSSPSSPAKPETPMLVEETMQYTMASFKIKTNQNAQVYIKYGLTKEKLDFRTSVTSAGTDHTVTISDNLPPATDIFYVIAAQNSAGTTETDVIRARTKGIPVRVALLDKELSPLRNQEVTLKPLGLKVKTDSSGFFSSSDIPPGDFTLEFTESGKTHAQYLHVTASVESVNGTQTATEQVRALVYDTYKTSAWNLAAIAQWTVVALAAFALGAIVLRSARGRRWNLSGFRRIFKAKAPAKDLGIVVGGTAKTETVKPSVIPSRDIPVPPNLSQPLKPEGPKVINPSLSNWDHKDGE